MRWLGTKGRKETRHDGLPREVLKQAPSSLTAPGSSFTLAGSGRNELRRTAVHPWWRVLPRSRRAVRGTPDHGFYQLTSSEAHLEVTEPLQQGDRAPGQRDKRATLRYKEQAGTLVPLRVWVPWLQGKANGFSQRSTWLWGTQFV